MTHTDRQTNGKIHTLDSSSYMFVSTQGITSIRAFRELRCTLYKNSLLCIKEIDKLISQAGKKSVD